MARMTPPHDAPAPSEPLPAAASAPDVPALNLAGGIARVMGDRALFARVLARFGSEYRQAASAIRNALGNGDTPLALRLVHTLKGAAGMIEAVPLSREALALERVLRNPAAGDAGTGKHADAGDPWQRLARLEQALDRVLLELDAVTGSVTASAAPSATASAASAPEAGGAPAHAADPAHTMRRLAALLDEGNGEAVDLVHEAAAALTTLLGTQRYGQLVDRIEAFDFDAALAVLAERR
jgi:HPt (histidine-containing phosphotransfer) domain-containing protein